MHNVQFLNIDSPVPYTDYLYWWLRGSRELRSENPIPTSHHYDFQYLAWQNVRKKRNPYFDNGTGFEGYFIGLCQTPEEALQQILVTSQRILTSITRLYRFDHRFISRLMKTLTGELSDEKAIYEWAVEFGAALGRLRVNTLHNSIADTFRAETYRIIRALPPIFYTEADHQVEQHYVLGFYTDEPNHKLHVDINILKPCDQDAWRVAESIGKFGHPLIRQVVHSYKP